MLRKHTTLLTPLRYFYNNRNSWQRYSKNMADPTEPLHLKKQFQLGDKAEFIYKNKIIFPKEYKPYERDLEPAFFIGILGIFIYLNWRYERKRQLNQRTYSSEYII